MTVTTPPAISVSGNGNPIIFNATSTSPLNNTDFGNAALSASIFKTYTISNAGTESLNISAITLSGADASHFTVSSPAPGTIPGGGSGNFVITFSPTNAGVKNATIYIANNDTTKNPFTFAVRGSVISNTTDYFRTIKSGDWSAADTWESSIDGLNWISPATIAPTEVSNEIIIRSNHLIKIDEPVKLDQLTIENKGQLSIHINSGKLTLNDGPGTDLDIRSGGVLQVIATANTSGIRYDDKIKFLGNASMNVEGSILVGDGSNFMGGGYGEFGYAPASQIIWNDNAILEWNTGGSVPEISGKIYFPGAPSDVIPILKITKSAVGFNGNSDFFLRGKFQLNSINIDSSGEGERVFRNGITAVGKSNMTLTAGSGRWEIGDSNGNAAAELAGPTGDLTLTNANGISILPSCYAVLTSNLKLGTNTKFTVKTGATLDFGFNNENIPLHIRNIGNSTVFTSEEQSVLKITSANGIQKSTSSTGSSEGNVVVRTTNYSGNATFHYVGRTNQSSGNGLPGEASAKKVIVELETLAPEHDNLNFTVNGIKYFTSAGEVEIRKGKVIDQPSNGFADVSFEDGKLTMSGGRYTISRGGTQPSLGGTYNLTGGVIEFAGTSAINIRTGNPAKQYLKVEVSGNNVSAGTTASAGLTMQPSGTFTVKDRGVFKVDNPAGFIGSTAAAIKSTNDPMIVLEDGSTADYSSNGNQYISSFKPLEVDESNINTGGYYNLRISGDDGDLETGTAKTILARVPIYVRNDLDVTAGARLIIDADQSIIVNKIIYSKGGSARNFLVESDGNLKQLDDTAKNSGPISVRRFHTFTEDRKEYNYLASPVEGQNMKFIFGQLSSNIPFVTKLNQETNLFVNAQLADYNIRAKGFAVKEPTITFVENASASIAADEAEYQGLPNNGLITIPLPYKDSDHGYNLVGNPYPSNIDIVELYNNSYNKDDDNPDIRAEFKFWDNSVNNFYIQQGGNYAGWSYAVFNAKSDYGTAAPGKATNSDSPYSAPGSKVPTRIVKTSQAFMVRALRPGAELRFNNEIRKVTNNSTVFYGKKAAIDRYRLAFTTPDQLVIQNAISYFGAGKNGIGIEDSFIPNASASDALFNIIENEKLIINGNSLFTPEHQIMLGTRNSKAGVYSIKVIDQEGVFSNGQPIYLKDRKSGILTDISQNAYNFISESGEFNNRFEIVYQLGSVLATNATIKSIIEVYRDANDFIVHSKDNQIGKIEVYDGVGRLVMTRNTKSKEVRIAAENFVSGMYILKIELQNGDFLTKKVRK